MQQLSSLNNIKLKQAFLNLMDEVSSHLSVEPDVDKFLDETHLFYVWEKVIPDAVYPIFIMAVLNNTRQDSIVNTIVDAIIRGNDNCKIRKKTLTKSKTPSSFNNDHPFS
ncbi:MAG: hypothetical protein HOB40_11055 [Candidatus Marinimicrobia bacterium]|jgi:hypothetical protein|nr:hypothetical protein [Candidatus Neomarinimicrobiota bacterium]MBT3502548.1 hypothetical protein [Candidatus Neomarinimicrobiota bacterium]MBT3839585.1 hypothetical protein [Candidatus Neomarinimicrobiota bacterium]MBT3999112.1 hypothetical protein [Candidatus Neomarinimicrobiota bacterium]MBT4282313.1 hypothetical protein [Candidatus Neomarinimicrobiota bacterium]